MIADILVGRHERRVIGRAHGLPDRSHEVPLAIELELRGIGLGEDAELVLPG